MHIKCLLRASDGIFIRATRTSPGTALHVDPIRHATINELSYFPFIIITATGISILGSSLKAKYLFRSNKFCVHK